MIWFIGTSNNKIMILLYKYLIKSYHYYIFPFHKERGHQAYSVFPYNVSLTNKLGFLSENTFPEIYVCVIHYIPKYIFFVYIK